PILFDRTRSDEPYIPLPAPHDNIRLTPWRRTDATDVDPVVTILNHPAVYPNLIGPPYPYLEEHAAEWATQQVEMFEPDHQYFTGDESAPIREGKIFDYSPIMVIREVQTDGSQILLGVADITKAAFTGEPDAERREERVRANEQKSLGDPSIIWAIGDYLTPTHHGRGIMTAVIGVLIHSWGVPYMRVRQLDVSVLDGNIGSRRVFEKLGFQTRR
ncbi:hypothetical protein CALCODRAFT_408409, partial [Calocera cornea HHB12733]